MLMPAPDILAIVAPIVLSIVGVGIALAALQLRTVARLDNAIAEAGADRRAADAKMEEFGRRMDQLRRDSDAKMDEFRGRMDEFRGHMQRLGERQAHLEGYRDGSAGPSPAPAE